MTEVDMANGTDKSVEVEIVHDGVRTQGFVATPEQRAAKAEARAKAATDTSDEAAMVALSAEIPEQRRRMARHVSSHKKAFARGSFVPPFVLSASHPIVRGPEPITHGDGTRTPNNRAARRAAAAHARKARSK